jgi:hypothetical protein
MSQQRGLIKAYIQMLEQGYGLLENLSGEIYRKDTHALFDGGVGKHIRHILNHYHSLLTCADGHLDYDARPLANATAN